MTSFLETLWDDIKVNVTADAAYVEKAVEAVFTAEVAVIKPILEEELTTFSASVATDPTIPGIVAAATALWANLGTKLPGVTLSTGVTTFITAVTTGMANAVTSTTAPATPAAAAAAPATGS